MGYLYEASCSETTRTSDRRWLGPATPCGEHHGCADGKVGVIEQREHVRDLLVRDEPGAHGLLPNLLEVGSIQTRAGGPALPHDQIAFHAYVDKAMRSQAPVQAPAPCQCQLTTSCCHEPVLGRHRFLKERRGSSICRRISGVDKGRVEIFHDEPASWLESRYHPLESLLAFWHVDEHQAGVDRCQYRGAGSQQWVGQGSQAPGESAGR